MNTVSLRLEQDAPRSLPPGRRRSARLCGLTILLTLGACGGGGGGGDGGAEAPAPSSSTPPATSAPFTISSNNVTQLASTAFSFSEFLQLNAETMISATLVSQLFGELNLPCGDFDGSGSRALVHMDSDGNGVLSSGDRVELRYADCDGADGEIALSIQTIRQTGQTLDALSGNILVTLTLAGTNFDLELSGSQHLEYAIDPTEIRWKTTEGRLIAEGGGVALGATSASVTFSIDVESDSYVFEISGVGQEDENKFDFVTTESFRGSRGQWPHQGVAILRTATSAGRIRHTDDFAARETQARYSVDPTNSGQFTLETYMFWPNLLSGAMIGVGDANYIPPPIEYFDLTSRRRYLQGVSADVVMDFRRNRLYFSITDRNEIAVVDDESLLVTERISIGPAPEGLWLSDNGDTLYVALSQGGMVAALDLTTHSVDYIDVVTALGNHVAYDVIETSPGILFVTSNPGPAGTGYLARIDRNAGDVVTRVADGRFLRDLPALAALPNGDYLYAGDSGGLYKLDLGDPTAPVVLERNVAADRNLSLSADGQRLYLRNGDILSTTTLQNAGSLEPGVPYALANGLDVLIAREDFSLAIYEAQTRLRVDQLSTKCGLDRKLDTVIPYGNPGQWMMLSAIGYCAFDFRSPGEMPGSDATIPPVIPEPTPISVTSEMYSFGRTVADIEFDALRNRLYLSDSLDGLIYSVNATTFETLGTFDVDGLPIGLDLDPFNTRLAIAIRGSVPLSILDLGTGVVESFDISEALGHNDAFDVDYAGDEAIFVSSSTGGVSYLVRAYADGTPAIRIADGLPISSSTKLISDTVAQRLYATDMNPAKVYALDIGQALAPIVANTGLPGTFSESETFLSPDGGSFVSPHGIVLRTGDLTQRGVIQSGAAAYAADGNTIAVYWGQNIHLYDPVTFTKRSIVDPNCDSWSSATLRQIGDRNDWLLNVGGSICRFQLPNESSSSIQFTTDVPATRKEAVPRGCDTDCVTRRYVLSRLGATMSRDYRSLIE